MIYIKGELAQMAERMICIHQVEGSMPSFSIIL